MVVRIYATVKNIGQVPVQVSVRGYVITPAGNTAYSQNSSPTTINPGQSQQFVVDVNVGITVAGTWKAGVEVYDATNPYQVWKKAETQFTVSYDISVSVDKVEIV